MRFLQHVYGRVSKGVRGNLPGYQLAAVSDGIAEDAELIARLNRFSFLDAARGQTAGVRYSYFRYRERYVAFGACRYARDQTGSIGAFAHNLVLSREEFLHSDCSPADVLTSFSFLGSESELPGLTLPEVEFEPTPRAVPDTITSLALFLVDSMLDKGPSPVLFVVLNEKEMWDLLSLVFHMLPRLEASKACFSSLFINAIDFIDGFKIVFVPERNCVPSGSSIIRVIDPSAGACPTRPPLLRPLWENHREQGPDFLRMVNALRHRPDRKEDIVPLLPSLVSLGSDFRRSVELLEVPGITEMLLLSADWITSYWNAGPGPGYGEIGDIVWKDPFRYLTPALQALARRDPDMLCTNLLRDCISRMQTDSLPLKALEYVKAAGALTGFLAMIAVEDSNAAFCCRLASRIRAMDGNDASVHDKVAAYALGLLKAPRSGTLEALLPWLSEESALAPPRSFFRAAAGCVAWRLDQKKNPWRICEYEMTAAQYERILTSLVPVMGSAAASLSGADWVLALHHPRFPQSFRTFLSRNLERLDFGFQKEVLDGIFHMVGLMPEADEFAVTLIEKSEKPRRLARYYLSLARSRPPGSRETLERLEGLAGGGSPFRWREQK